MLIVQEFSLTLTSRREEEKEEELAIIDFGFDGLEYSINDLQGRFNLNNLANPDATQLAQQRRIFLNLLTLLEIGDADSRLELIGTLVDWLDENDNPDSNGFESNDYQTLDTPYHAADQKLTALGELKFLRGFSDEIIAGISPFVTILPVENSRININTTSPEVLASLSSAPVTDLESVSTFLARRLEDEFQGFGANDVNLAINAIIGASVIRQSPVPRMLQTNSQFYQVQAKVSLGEAVYCMKTLVLRESPTQGSTNTPKVSVLRREYDTICEDITPDGAIATAIADQSTSDEDDLNDEQENDENEEGEEL